MVTTTGPTRRRAGITVRPRRRKPLVPMSARMPYVPGMLYLTRRRWGQLLDRQARKYLGMSGEEFARRYRAGEIEDPCRSEVILLSMMLPPDDL
jgi:hypothetical protein